VPSLEEIAYEAGRQTLADQEASIAGIRQRTSTLLAAHALVASFLGSEALHSAGFVIWSWLALAALFVGLTLAAVLLASWDLRFVIEPDEVFAALGADADAKADDGLTWLSGLAFGYQRLRDSNKPVVDRMSRLASILAVLMVVQTVGWISALVAVR
jgi:hypothetical protein